MPSSTLQACLPFFPINSVLWLGWSKDSSCPPCMCTEYYHTTCPRGFCIPLVHIPDSSSAFSELASSAQFVCEHLKQELCLWYPGNSIHSILSTCIMHVNFETTETQRNNYLNNSILTSTIQRIDPDQAWASAYSALLHVSTHPCLEYLGAPVFPHLLHSSKGMKSKSETREREHPNDRRWMKMSWAQTKGLRSRWA